MPRDYVHVLVRSQAWAQNGNKRFSSTLEA
jgi:hypothetical protein